MKKHLDKTPFPKRFRELCKQAKLKGTKVAKALDVTQPAVSKWGKGGAEPSLINLVKVADLLGVSTDYLLGRTNVSAPVTINGNQNAANIVDSTVSIGGSNARLEAEVLRLTRECERLCAENERLRSGQ